MKAIVYHNNGSGDVLKLEEIEKPVPRDDEVLIKVRAASVNPIDYHTLRHRWLRRVLVTVAKIETSRPGRDLAGQVELSGLASKVVCGRRYGFAACCEDVAPPFRTSLYFSFGLRPFLGFSSQQAAKAVTIMSKSGTEGQSHILTRRQSRDYCELISGTEGRNSSSH